jgi:hypothetical protein
VDEILLWLLTVTWFISSLLVGAITLFYHYDDLNTREKVSSTVSKFKGTSISRKQTGNYNRTVNENRLQSCMSSRIMKRTVDSHEMPVAQLRLILDSRYFFSRNRPSGTECAIQRAQEES